MVQGDKRLVIRLKDQVEPVGGALGQAAAGARAAVAVLPPLVAHLGEVVREIRGWPNNLILAVSQGYQKLGSNLMKKSPLIRAGACTLGLSARCLASSSAGAALALVRPCVPHLMVAVLSSLVIF